MKQAVIYHEEKSIVESIDRYAEHKGISRSDFLRMAVREKLARSPSSTSFDTSPEQLLTMIQNVKASS